MSSVLPQGKLAATRFNPKIMVMYGMPKVGKTTALTELDSCLILDFEDGASTMESLRIKVNSIEGKTFYVKDDKGKDTDVVMSTSLNQVYLDICQFGADLAAAGKPVTFPFRRIAFDTGDMFEEMCEKVATRKYKETILGKNFDGDSVLELAKGAGYGLLRTEVIDNLVKFSRVCETVVLICHTKDKIIDKGGVEISSKELSLTGKLGSMICAKADLITYLYRETGRPLMCSLETLEVSGTTGARKFDHLKPLYGTKFEFAWNKLLIDPK